MRNPIPSLIIGLCLAHGAALAGDREPLARLQGRIIALELRSMPHGATASPSPATPHAGLLALMARRQRGSLSVADESRLIAALQDEGLLERADTLLRASKHTHRTARLRQARLWLARGRAPAARAAIEDLLPNKDDDALRRLRALISIALDKPREARDWLRAIRTRRAIDDYRLAHLWRDERPARARTLLEAAFERGRPGEPAHDRAGIELARTDLAGGRPAKAIAWLEGISRDGAEADEALYLLGLAEWRLKQRHQAIRYWDGLQDRLPIDRAIADALLALPYGLAEIGAPDEAIGRYRETVRSLERAVGTLSTALEGLDERGLPAVFTAGPEAIGALGRLPTAPFLIERLASPEFVIDWRRLALLTTLDDRARGLEPPPGDILEAIDERRREVQGRMTQAVRQELERHRAYLLETLNEARYGLAHMLDERQERALRR